MATNGFPRWLRSKSTGKSLLDDFLVLKLKHLLTSSFISSSPLSFSAYPPALAPVLLLLVQVLAPALPAWLLGKSGLLRAA
jgi:hypothetical protein